MRAGFVVALIGPDGAGKSTVARRLPDALRPHGIAASTLYMGVSADSADRLLPTTKLARRVKRALGAPPDTRGPRTSGAVLAAGTRRSPRGHARAALRLANRLAEEGQRELATRRRTRRGEVVVHDRHFLLDFHATDVTEAQLPWDRRLHGAFLRRAMAVPDLVIHLDAPAEVLHRRKGEGTIEALATRQREYERLEAVVPRFRRVSSEQPLEATVEQVVALIVDLRRERRAGG